MITPKSYLQSVRAICKLTCEDESRELQLAEIIFNEITRNPNTTLAFKVMIFEEIKQINHRQLALYGHKVDIVKSRYPSKE